MKQRRGKGRDGLYCRENGILAFRYKGLDGHWREKYTGTADRQEAIAEKDKFLTNVRQRNLPTSKAKWTVAQAATEWVEQHAARSHSAKARSNERSYLRQLLRRLGTRTLESLTLDDLKRYQTERRKEVRERPINLELRILINVLKEVNLWNWVGSHYKDLAERQSDVGCALTREELSRLFAVASSRPEWLVAFLASVLAANTGLRGGEIKKLRLQNLDLSTRRIRIDRRGTKSDAGARLIELNRAAMTAATSLLRRAVTLGAMEPEHYLLPAQLSRHTKQSDPLRGVLGFDPQNCQNSWDSAWRSLRTAAGLRKLRFHDLRHTFITMMAEQGVPLPVVQAMVGHMSIAMVRHYTHISNNAARNAVELLDSLENDQTPTGLWGNLWGSTNDAIN